MSKLTKGAVINYVLYMGVEGNLKGYETMTRLLGGVKQTTRSFFEGGGRQKSREFHCIRKFDLAVINFEIFKISAR